MWVFCFLELEEDFEIDYMLLNLCLGSSKTPYNLSDTVEFIFFTFVIPHKRYRPEFLWLWLAENLRWRTQGWNAVSGSGNTSTLPLWQEWLPVRQSGQILYGPKGRYLCWALRLYFSWPTCSLELRPKTSACVKPFTTMHHWSSYNHTDLLAFH